MQSQKGSLPIIGLVTIAVVVALIVVFIARNSQRPQPVNPPVPQTTQAEPQPTAEQMGLKFDNPPAKADSFGDKKGPFYHQIFMATSPDGLNFTKGELLFDQASVPDIIRLPSGRLLAYMVDGARRSKSGIMVALSDDNGKSWDQGSVQIKTPEGKQVMGADPEIILLKDSRLRLYTLFGPKPEPGKIQINWVQSAISSDGINFEAEEGKRFESKDITDPDVVNINGKYFMYLSQGPKLITASSDDGLTFNLEKTIRENGSVSNTVYVDVDFYRQFYCFEGSIKSAKTADGLNFTDEPGFRLIPESGKMICDPAPVHLGGSWLMLYKVAK